jgi:hypothetical protein
MAGVPRIENEIVFWLFLSGVLDMPVSRFGKDLSKTLLVLLAGSFNVNHETPLPYGPN